MLEEVISSVNTYGDEIIGSVRNNGIIYMGYTLVGGSIALIVGDLVWDLFKYRARKDSYRT